MFAVGQTIELPGWGVGEITRHLPPGGRSQAFKMRKHGGGTFFLKAFVEPKFPIAGSEKTRRRNSQAFAAFQAEKTCLYAAASQAASAAPTLVRNYGLHRVGELLCGVFEFIDALQPAAERHGVRPTIRNQLLRHDPAVRLAILDDIATALDALHERRIVHGDIKLENAVIYKSGEKTHIRGRGIALKAKLIDYCDGYFEGSPPTSENGLPFGYDTTYAAPEVEAHASSDKSPGTASRLSRRSDIFSFGMVAAALLTDASLEEISQAVRRGASANIDSADLRSLPEMREIILSSLSGDPANRPCSAEFLKSIRARTFGLPAMRPDIERSGWRRSPIGKLADILLGQAGNAQLDQPRLSWETATEAAPKPTGGRIVYGSRARAAKARLDAGASETKPETSRLVVSGKPTDGATELPKIILPGA